VIAIGVVALTLLAWTLRDLFLLFFGAVLVSIIFDVVARPLRDRFGVPAPLALVSAVLAVAGLVAATIWLFGAEIIRQSDALGEMVPAAWQATLSRLDGWGLGGVAREAAAALQAGSGSVANVGRIAVSVGSGFADFLLVLVAAIYIAAQPDLYWAGILKIVPKQGRSLVSDALRASSRGLRLWLLGRLVSMATVGFLTWIGLSVIGVPSAVSLALLAALLEFIPFLGPILAAVPAVLLAFAAGPEKAFATVTLFLIIQQLEGNVLEPLIQQRAVELPPVILLFGMVAGGVLFGPVGIILGAPLTVVLYILVKRLYVREALDTATPIPGDKAA
jgi:predicted PurR-regulated permease PerM